LSTFSAPNQTKTIARAQTQHENHTLVSNLPSWYPENAREKKAIPPESDDMKDQAVDENNTIVEPSSIALSGFGTGRDRANLDTTMGGYSSTLAFSGYHDGRLLTNV